MAISKFLLAFLISAFLFISMIQAHGKIFNTNGIADRKIDCGTECFRRCSLSSRPNLCHKACDTCCARCNCVPPGTAGNNEVCPCWANQTTHGGQKKCP